MRFGWQTIAILVLIVNICQFRKRSPEKFDEPQLALFYREVANCKTYIDRNIAFSIRALVLTDRKKTLRTKRLDVDFARQDLIPYSSV